MQVLDDQDQRLPLGSELDESAPGAKERDPVADLALGGPEGCCQLLCRLRCLDISGGRQPVAERVAQRVRARIVGQLEDGQEDGAHRPVGQPLAIGQALGDGDPGWTRMDLIEELLEKPRLPDASRSHDADEVRSMLFERAPSDQLELHQIGTAAHERMAGAHVRAPRDAPSNRRAGTGVALPLASSAIGEPNAK